MFLSKTSVGLDITDNSIEVVQLRNTVGNIKLMGKNRMTLPVGIVDQGVVKSEKKLALALKKLFSTAGPTPIRQREVVFGIPERHVYTHVLTMPTMKKKEIEDAVKEGVFTDIPLEKDNILFEYRVISRSKDSMNVLVVAADKSVVTSWKTFFKKLGLRVSFFDIETLAVFRDLYRAVPKEPVCIIDMGSYTTNIAIFDHTGLHHAYTLYSGGHHMTEIIARALGSTYDDAEKEKVNVGFAIKNKKAQLALKDVIIDIGDEIKRIISFYEKQYEKDIKEIVLVGGMSQMKGMTRVLKKITKKEVKIGQSQTVANGDALLYIEAIGLALKPLNTKWQKEPHILLSK